MRLVHEVELVGTSASAAKRDVLHFNQHEELAVYELARSVGAD